MTTFPSHIVQSDPQTTADGGIRRVLIECTHTLGSDLNTGIQRVVRSIIGEAWSLQRELGVRCIPVTITDGRFHDATQAWRRRYGPGDDDLPNVAQGAGSMPLASGCRQPRDPEATAWGVRHAGENREDTQFQFLPRDVLLLLDSSWHLPAWEAVAEAARRGCTIGCVYYDLIPVDFPEFCDETLARLFREWLNQAMRHVDFSLAISQTVSRSVQHHAQTACPPGANRVRGFDYFRLGADFSRQAASHDVRQQLQEIFQNDNTSTAPYLTVGTMEPRKNHGYLLDAFEIVWQQCPRAKLCIVGRVGWKVDELLNRIRRHPRFGKSLFVFNDLNDAELQWCYQRTKAFVFPSIVEGFGLPIVEALHHGLRVMASDTPIHREVGQDFCVYFDLKQPESAARLIVDLEQQDDFPTVPAPASYQFTTWKQSCRELLTKCLKQATDVARRPQERGAIHSLSRSTRWAAGLLDRLDLQAAKPLTQQVRYRDLVRYHDRRFVETAYHAILNRPVDPEGAIHIERLRAGKSKLDTLLSIKNSPEGRRSKAKVRGLWIRGVLRKLERIPVLGYVVSLLVCLATLPRQRRHQDRSNHHLLSLFTQLEEHLNGNDRRVENALANCVDLDLLDAQQASIEQTFRALEAALLRQAQTIEETAQQFGTQVRDAEFDVRDINARVDRLVHRTEHRIEQIKLDLAELGHELDVQERGHAA